MDNFLNEIKSNNEEFSEEYISMMKQYYQKLTNNPTELANQVNNMKTNMNQPDSEGGLVILPEKFCCVKTHDKTGQKVFINILSHEKVEAPQEQHILEMNSQLGVRVPLSLSEKYEDFDVKNQACQVYDVIFNSNVVKKAENEQNILQFLVTIIIGRIRERFSHELSPSFIKLKNLTYKGKAVRLQRVRVKKVKIEEVLIQEDPRGDNSGNNTTKYHSREISKEINEKGKTPSWNFIIIKSELTCQLLKEICLNSKEIIEKKLNITSESHLTHTLFSFFDGYNANPKYGEGFLFLIELEILAKSSGINVNICDEGLTVYCAKLYSLELNMPFKINSEDAFSFFDTDTRILFIYAPFYLKDIEEFQMLSSIEQNQSKSQSVKISEDYLYDVII